MMICVPAQWSQAAPGYNDQGWASESSTADYSTKKDAAYPTTKDGSGSSGGEGRHLLAAVSPNVEKATKCGDNYTQLFPKEAIHGIHIFIALTAIVHIFYACISMALCLWRVRDQHQHQHQQHNSTI
jgi:hypothetical protein